MESEWLSTGEVAKRLGVARSTVSRWISLEQIRYVRLPSGHYRIPRTEVEKLLREVREEP
jgi:excisionase family DNA binding protein